MFEVAIMLCSLQKDLFSIEIEISAIVANWGLCLLFWEWTPFPSAPLETT